MFRGSGIRGFDVLLDGALMGLSLSLGSWGIELNVVMPWRYYGLGFENLSV